MTVSTGIYTYPFEVELPESLPTSCEGKYGFIRYLASVNIVRPNQPVQTQTVAFTVIKPKNLNKSPLFQVSSYTLTEKKQLIKILLFVVFFSCYNYISFFYCAPNLFNEP